MKMSYAILPGHNSPGNIKDSANCSRSLFSILVLLATGQTSQHDREILSLLPHWLAAGQASQHDRDILSLLPHWLAAGQSSQHDRDILSSPPPC